MTPHPRATFHFVEVTGQPLDFNHYAALVSDPGAGAISSFIGVTRDNFQGKNVLRLEYEAYVPMAVKKLKVRLESAGCAGAVCHLADNAVAAKELCMEVSKRWDVKKVAIGHRTGVVGVRHGGTMDRTVSNRVKRRNSDEGVHPCAL